MGVKQRAVARARVLAGRLDDPDVRRARRMVRLFRRHPPDVLNLSDSTDYAWNLTGDRRTVGEMLSELLAPATVHTVAGGGYHPGIHDALARLVPVDRPPRVLTFSLAVRVSTTPAWFAHPVHAHRPQIAKLLEFDSDTPPWRIRGGCAPPTPQDWAEFEKVRHPTLLGDLTVHDYMKVLRGQGAFQRPEYLRYLVGYHHTNRFDPDTFEGMPMLDEFAKTVNDLGCPVVMYQPPICMEVGEELFGDAFREVVTHNVDTLAAEMTNRIERARLVPSSFAFTKDEFHDPHDGTEHVNAAGRMKHARMIAEEIRKALADG
jgi:hypothetical protein